MQNMAYVAEVFDSQLSDHSLRDSGQETALRAQPSALGPSGGTTPARPAPSISIQVCSQEPLEQTSHMVL